MLVTFLSTRNLMFFFWRTALKEGVIMTSTATMNEHAVSFLIRRIDAVAPLLGPGKLGIVFVGTPREMSQVQAWKRVSAAASQWKAHRAKSTVTFFVRFDDVPSGRVLTAPSQEVLIGRTEGHTDRWIRFLLLLSLVGLLGYIIIAVVLKRIRCL